MVFRLPVTVLALVSAVSVMGCATSAGLLQAKTEMNSLQQSGQCAAAAQLAEQRLNYAVNQADVAPVTGGILDHIEAADSWRMCGNLERAIAHYDAAEESIKTENAENGFLKAGQWLRAAVTNDTARGYQPTPVEGVLTNLNKAVIFWDQGQPALARVEFNRADERTRRAIEKYAKQIEKAQDKEQEQQAQSAVSAVDSAMPEISQWKVYNSFMNPASALMQALWVFQSKKVIIRCTHVENIRSRGKPHRRTHIAIQGLL